MKQYVITKSTTKWINVFNGLAPTTTKEAGILKKGTIIDVQAEDENKVYLQSGMSPQEWAQQRDEVRYNENPLTDNPPAEGMQYDFPMDSVDYSRIPGQTYNIRSVKPKAVAPKEVAKPVITSKVETPAAETPAAEAPAPAAEGAAPAPEAK